MLNFHSIHDPRIAELLQAGQVGVLPTDTLYGLVARADNPSAIARLYATKHRKHKPGTLIAANIDQLVELGFKRRYLKAVEAMWPNPLSIVIPCPELEFLHLGKQSLAVRIPANETLRNFLSTTGPLQTTSVNLPDQAPAANLVDAIKVFGDEVDFYVDGGDLSNNQPSTIIRFDDDAITILRPGACHIDEHGNISNDDELVV